MDNLQARVEEIKLLYQVGFSSKQVAKRLGVSRQRVHQILSKGKDFEMKPQPRGRGRKPLTNEEKKLRQADLRLQQYAIDEIGKVLTDWSTARLAKCLGFPYHSIETRKKSRGFYPTKFVEIYTLWNVGLGFADIELLTGSATGGIASCLNRARGLGLVKRYRNEKWATKT